MADRDGWEEGVDVTLHHGADNNLTNRCWLGIALPMDFRKSVRICTSLAYSTHLRLHHATQHLQLIIDLYDNIQLTVSIT